MKIQKLPAEARSKLQSGILVTDAVQCVMELVQNSLDAGASGIAIRIDLKNYRIRVIDNGKGIDKDDLEFVGERFMTSKYQSPMDKETAFPTYGYSGQALASLRSVSRFLKIETKSHDEGPVLVKVFQDNKALPIRESDNEQNGTGTTVTVEDFMYEMPVRRKRINEVFDLEEIKMLLQNLAIIHFTVCFTLRNENKGVILLQTAKAFSILESVKNIYGKSLANSLAAVHYQDKKYVVSGFISLKPQTKANPQLVYINRIITKKGVIHKFINNLIKEYNGKEGLFVDTPADGVIKNLRISSHTAFIILINCPRMLCELFTNIRKTTVEFKNWTDVLKCVHRGVKGALKKALNLDSSNSQPEKKEPEGDTEGKKAFGTSLLVNAVRGVPAKRGLDCKKDAKKRKKLKSNESNKNSKNLSRNNDKLVVTENQKKRNAHDSFESPIPKKNLIVSATSDSAFKNIGAVNQSFMEFYEWLKTKFDSDMNAFTLYNDFLKFKNQASQPIISNFKSPVLGGKLKRKKVGCSKKKNLGKSLKKDLGRCSVLDEEMAIVTKNQLKIFPNSQLRVKRGVQFTTEVQSRICESWNINNIGGENFNCEKSSELMFKKPDSVQVTNKNVEYNHTILSSLPSSEVQFTNIIKFRNMSESFLQQPPQTEVEVPIEKVFGSSSSNTWMSHYQDIVLKNTVTEKETERHPWKENLYNICEGNLDVVANEPGRGVRVQDVEIQVEILRPVPQAQKVNAAVQTLQSVPETPSFESNYAFHQEIDIPVKKVGSDIEFLRGNLRQDVPEPDFWNTSEYMQLEQDVNPDMNGNISKHLTEMNNKDSASVEFVCGHKSHSSSNQQYEKSTFKATQTIADVWTDSLTEMEYSANGYTSANPDKNKLESGDTELPKTLPIEEVVCNASQQDKPGFCLTERHDFVPKGLSPKFLNLETTKIKMLSPSEKCKIKSAIDNTQNELLANIKWQDESTGDCIKPKIPDAIFFEMNQRVGESVMNYGDPVLSAALSYCAVKVHNLLHSFTFTKEILTGVEILGQLDKKFIATKIKITVPKKMELISLFDQHAVDERIKLEEIIKENVSSEGKFISTSLNPPVECSLSKSHVRIISEFSEKILSFGLIFEPVNDNTILVTQAPSFLINKQEKDLKNKKEISLSDALKSLIVNVLEEMTETRGAGSKIPKVMHNAFCLEACHKAIKFNRGLSVEEMTEMINKLQNCTLPFQCAHGRPSVIPIIDLEEFKPEMEENENNDLQKLKKFFNERKEDDIIQNSENF